MMIRRIPNGEIPDYESSRRLVSQEISRETRGSETSQYPEEKKSKEIP